MKYIALWICFFILTNQLLAQPQADPINLNNNDSLLRATLLSSIQAEHRERNEEYNKQIQELNGRIIILDKKLEEEKDAQKKVVGLIERVQILEKREQAAVNNVESVYQQNYQTAVVNLFFMERELKPLILFNSTKDFFGTLSDVSNPMNYSGYNVWFAQFKTYIEENKKKAASLEIVDKLLNLGAEKSQSLPLAGPIANALFDGISMFINSFSKKEEKLREESIKMFELTATLSQFVHERDLIEHNWENLNKELDELQKLQAKCLEENLTILGILSDDFYKNFTQQTDANKYFEYIKKITAEIEQLIQKEHRQNPEKWKTRFYYQMQTVQSLKIRFGNLTFRIKENIAQYHNLIGKYAKSEIPEMKEKMRELSVKLDRLNSAFDKQFSPQNYIHAAAQMYIVD